MKHTVRTAAMLLLSFSLAGFMAPATAAEPTGTTVGGPLTADTVWTAAAGPYDFVSTVSVAEGATLTIEAGVVLRQPSWHTGEPMISVAGTVRAAGTEADPVLVERPVNYSNTALLGSAADVQSAVVDLAHVEIPGQLRGWAGGDFADFSMTDSLMHGSLTLDNTNGAITLQRNTFVGTEYNSAVTIANPRAGFATITDNRFRSTWLACNGNGRLTATRNTFERRTQWSYTGVSSADDCRFDASGNYWEATDEQIPSRIQGAARVVHLPSADEPSDTTPAFAPAQHSQERFIDNYGRAQLNVYPGSDGGLEATVVALATNRETGLVEATMNRPQRSWRTSSVEHFTFDTLTPGTLYRLSSYTENALGRSSVVETESFIAPEPIGSDPDEPGSIVSGTLDEDTTWTAAESPYDFDGTVTVPDGITLTIEPGVVLRQPNWSSGLPMISVAGSVVALGTTQDPIRVEPVQQYWNSMLFGAPEAMQTGNLDLAHLESAGGMTIWDGGNFTSFSMTDSQLGGALSLDASSGDITLRRNAFVPNGNGGVAIANPRTDHVTITDNRFRNSYLTCSGAGRLTAIGNTFERGFRTWQGSGVSSSDDCFLTVSSNFWEATDDQIENRIGGRARVVHLPTAVASSADTPTLAPASHQQSHSFDEYGRATLRIDAGSTGGLATTLTAFATDRETHEVVETQSLTQPSGPDGQQMQVVFDDLVPGSLYRLTTRFANDAGTGQALETESFIAPSRTPAPPPDGGTTVIGTITADTTWTAAEGPYEFSGSVHIPEGVTLTIAEGVVLRPRWDADDYRYAADPLFKVDGRLVIAGSRQTPVLLTSEGQQWRTINLARPLSDQSTAEIDISGLRTDLDDMSLWPQNPQSGAPESRFARFRLVDSTVTSPLRLDGALGEIELARNLIWGSSLSINNARAGYHSIADNRFRASSLECLGEGRLEATENTFERNTWVSAGEDCVLDIVENYWEATEADAAGRIAGAARVLFRPIAASPSAATPETIPVTPSASRYFGEAGESIVGVSTGSDGGAPAELHVNLENRETGLVEQSRSLPQGDALSDHYEEVEFDGLTPGVLYRFQVSSSNIRGSSDTSRTESFLAPTPPVDSTPPPTGGGGTPPPTGGGGGGGGGAPAAAAPDAPTEVSATAGDGWAEVAWARAKENNSPVTGYTVTASPGGSQIATAADATSTRVPGLANGTSYTFTVTANSSAGAGPASNASNAVVPVGPPLAPTSVSATPRGGSATVTWNPAGDGGSPVTAYVVTVSPGGAQVTVSGTTTRADIPGLANGTAYSFTVTAQNAIGSSSASAPSNDVTPASRPDRVEQPASRMKRSGALVVTWAAPRDNGSPILDYVIRIKSGGNIREKTVSTTKLILESPKAGKRFRFSVAAVNGIGASRASLWSEPIRVERDERGSW